MKNGIRFTLEPKQRPKLAKEIGKILGTAPHYERVPSCAYDIAGYRLDKEGVLHIPEGVAVEMVEHLIRQLRECGFQDDAEFTEEVPMFPYTEDGDEIAAYTQFITGPCDMAKDAKRVSSKQTETDNDKYAFRCFLLRLGFIGKEYKTARKILLRNLTGNSAFHYGE